MNDLNNIFFNFDKAKPNNFDIIKILIQLKYYFDPLFATL